MCLEDDVLVALATITFDREHDIALDEKAHKYTVQGHTFPRSVTWMASSVFPPFNAEKVASRPSVRAKNKGMSVAQIVDMWKTKGIEAARRGTEMHEAIEHFITLDTVPLHLTEWPSIADYFSRCIYGRGIIALRSEIKIYGWDGAVDIAGCIDCLGVDAEGQVTMFDWKRTEAPLPGTAFEQCLPPLEHLGATNHVKYSLQMHIYRWILLKYYGTHVDPARMFIVRFYGIEPFQETACLDLSREVDAMFSKLAS